MPTHEVVVLTRPEPTRDRHNNRTVDWSSAVRSAYWGRVQPSATTETVQQSDQLVTTWDCHLPPTAEVSSGDRVEVDGSVYEVDGTPFVHKGWGPIAALDHITIRLKEMSG